MKKMLLGVVTASTLLLAGVGHTSDNLDLLHSYGCLQCHNVNTKLIGPSFKDIAGKYAGQAGASAYFADRILRGSSNIWGWIPMPPNANLRPSDAKTLADFILTLK